MKLNNSTYIVTAKLINSDDGTETTLFERERSRCHFMEVFPSQGYLIQLRLHWDDIKNGDPVLDADIWTEINGKKDFLKRKDQPWHRTEKRFDEQTGKKLYTFQFRNLTLHLIAELTIEKKYIVGTTTAYFAPEAWKALEELDEKVRNLVRQRALKLAREKGRDLNVRLEDVLEAKELELKKREK